MNSAPKISVVMPFYNAEKFLDTAIQSILHQTFSDFEFIIINDCSTDNSDSIVRKYLSDPRIIYTVNTTRVGISKNLNSGILKARALIIARMDGDDISELTRLEKQFFTLKTNPNISIIGSSADVINEKDQVIDHMTFVSEATALKEQSFFRGPFLHPTVMFTKEAFINVGGYNCKYELCEDIDFFLKILFSGYSGMNLDETLLKYRKHSQSTDTKILKKALLGFKIKTTIARKYNIKISYKIKFFLIMDFMLTFFPRTLKMHIVRIGKKILNLK